MSSGDSASPSPSQEPEEPDRIIDDITTAYDGIQKDFSEAATLAGEEKERFEALKPAWTDLANRATDDPDIAEVYASGIDVLAAFRDELTQFRPRAHEIATEFTEIFPSSDGTSSTTSVTVSIVSLGAVTLPDAL